MSSSRPQRRIAVLNIWISRHTQEIALGAAIRAQAAGFAQVAYVGDNKQAPLAVEGYVGLFDRALARKFRQAGQLAVNVSAAHAELLELPSVVPDNRAAGRLAARHLLECGCTTLVFIGRPGLLYSAERAAGARAAARAAGRPFLELANAAAALRAVPLPFGVIGAEDTLALSALETVLAAGLHVPEQVAVIGFDNEDYECLSAPVLLSSVDLNGRLIGDRAARLLVRLLAGRPAPRRPIRVRPAGVIARASTDPFATTDPTVARFIRFAREHLADGLLAKDVARKLGMARQHLCWLFRQRAHGTPVAMLQQLAVVRAKQLLAGGQLSLREVAAQCGYDSVSHFTAVFVKLAGVTPAAYRRPVAVRSPSAVHVGQTRPATPVREVGILRVLSNSYSEDIALGAAACVRAAGYRPVVRHGWEPGTVLNLAGYVGLFGLPELQLLRASRIPAVNVSQTVPDLLTLPSVLPDDHAAGRLAAQHLLERGYRRIVFAGLPDMLYSTVRAAGVRAAVSQAGGDYQEWAAPAPAPWRALPQPYAVVGADDAVAHQVIEALLQAGLRVPEQVAVIGITNIEHDCVTAPVPLTSVRLDGRAIGEQAARLLLRLMAGEAAPREPILVAPAGIAHRGSTDMLAAADRQVQRVICHARDHLADGIQVAGLAARFGCSRQQLNRLFRERADFTPVQMLQQWAVTRAKQLLADSDLPLPQVAARCGYESLSHFGVLFAKLTKTSPDAYRQRCRRGCRAR